MRTSIAVTAVLLLAGMAFAEQVKPNTLTPQEISEGWILLFDGETSFGWKNDVNADIKKGTITPSAGKLAVFETTTEFSDFELSLEYIGSCAGNVKLVLNEQEYALEPNTQAGGMISWTQGLWKVATREAKPSEFEALGIKKQGKGKKKVLVHDVTATFAAASMGGPDSRSLAKTTTGKGASRTTIALKMPADSKLSMRNIKLKPLGGKSIFNGKDLTGWNVIPGHKSKFTVTDKGELNIKDGAGDIQTEGQWDDFILQLDVFSNGEHLNSGIFFRGIPGEFWSGYECQIRNEWKGYEKGKPRDAENEDRTQPVDFGTGALYARQPTRKVVTNDREWFTVTVVTNGAHVATWVNGYQCTDYQDTKKDDRNARQGRYTGPGPISLQGHDPTTDLSFKNIKVAGLQRR